MQVHTDVNVWTDSAVNCSEWEEWKYKIKTAILIFPIEKTTLIFWTKLYSFISEKCTAWGVHGSAHDTIYAGYAFVFHHMTCNKVGRYSLI